MALTETPAVALGAAAPDFELADWRGERFTLADVRGPRGLLVMFICNHCPYVLATIDRAAADARALIDAGVGVVAVMPNDWSRYPDDAPEHMGPFAEEHGFSFPYLVDADQSVAKAYGAVCTPDYFGYDADLKLRYRGRLDAGRIDPPPADAPRELLEAMRAVAETGAAPAEQNPSMGCSIKWRE